MAELKPSFPKKLKGVIGSARARANELARARLIDSLTEGALTTNNFQIPLRPSAHLILVHLLMSLVVLNCESLLG